jgi:hypothetical protein
VAVAATIPAVAAIEFKLARRFPYAAGRSFGRVGAYEQIDGILTFAVDPSNEANRLIVDLARAPRGDDGRVRFSADFSVVRPVEPTRGVRRAVLELPNRGRRRVVDTFNRSGAEAAASAAPGDGFLFERGLTVASIGWQWDVYRDDVLMGLDAPLADLRDEADPGQTVVEIRPNERRSTWLLADRVHRPLRAADVRDPQAGLYVKDHEEGDASLIPRARWSFARETPAGVVPSDEHIFLDGGFEPGRYYQLVYRTKDAPVAGAGLLAFRDAAALLKYGLQKHPPRKHAPEAVVPDLPTFEHVIGYGVSQTGRMIRHFLYLGLNVDEGGRKVFDGLLPHVAGARMGAFNHRYAQPSNQSYPGFGHRFPFADSELTDPVTGRKDGLVSRLKAKKAQPKVIYTNSSAEYWRGDCSLMHTDPAGRHDLEGDANSRIYHFAGTQHGPGTLPQTRAGAAEGALGMYGYNAVDYSPLLRAALVNLEKWVVDGIEPPASLHPRLSDETAVARDAVLTTFDRLGDQKTPARSTLWVLKAVDLGPRASEGIGTYPTTEGATYPCLVPAVDGDGNELAGIRLPDLTRPVATHTGWNLRDPSTGSPEQQIPMQGFSRWFPRTRDERERTGDPRRSVHERYADRERYRQLVVADARKLASERYILEEDVDLVVDNALARYDAAMDPGRPPG